MRNLTGIVAACAIAAAAMGFVAVASLWRGRTADAPTAAGVATGAVGGPFHLTDQTGRRVDERILRGRWTAVFFGYTFCPDVCPTTLTTLGGAVQALGGRAGGMRVVFITVDPARDTPAQLRGYLASPAFPPGVIGLTGGGAEIAAAARAYRVYYKKAPDPADKTGANYSMDHTSVVYLMDPKGQFNRPLDMSATPAGVADQISRAMSGT